MDKTKTTSRLRRIEGQVRGIQGMINTGRDLTEIVTQLQAARSSISGLITNLLEDEFKPTEEGLLLDADKAALLLRLLRD